MPTSIPGSGTAEAGRAAAGESPAGRLAVPPATKDLAQERPASWLAEALGTLVRTKPLGAAGGVVVIALLVAALLAPYLAP